MDKKIMVLGFPRSGTGSMAKKLNLGHERENENGISDWHRVIGIGYDREKYKIIHVIRNPIDIIASNIFTISPDSINFMREGANIENKSLLSTIVEAFIKWTNAIETIGPDEVVNIEDIDMIRNSRPHPKLNWTDLKQLPPELVRELHIIAIKYGYDPNDK